MTGDAPGGAVLSRVGAFAPFGQRLELVAQTGSTNADLVAALSSGAPLLDGAWRIAERQTAGRGRLGRAWNDGAGNFMGSCAVRLGKGEAALASDLAFVAGLAVADAVARYLPHGRVPQLKWPNDVLVDGAKLAGILLERVGQAVVVGVGVNLAVAPQVAGRATVALADLAPACPQVSEFGAALDEALMEHLALWRRHGRSALLMRWQAGAHPQGTPLTASLGPDMRVSGLFAGLADDGALRLALADGTTRTLHAGDINLA
jgi:BirA family biotin operon repressor/biotin-[acetyl-CoA-carboxylase] ligase